MRRRRPRVLLVDDHQSMLETVSSVLADTFDVAGRASDGLRALDVAPRVDPDLIVLDVTMPGLDGFQTFRALEENGSRAPVVFLSMHDSDDYVGEAFQCGGRGYVLKTRVARDLPAALDHVLDGRLFVPSLSSLLEIANSGGHAIQIYGDDLSLLESAAGFFEQALRRGDATCVFGTEWLREGLAEQLKARGWDVDAHPRFIAVDAADALDRVMDEGMPDASRLAEIAAELDQYRLSTAEGAGRRLTLFGNMVSVLRVQGNDEAVLAVERLWNTLTQGLPFFTVCGYSTACFERDSALVAEACRAHGLVSHARDS
jgi:CheY-like chemotaxis protein